MPLTPSSCKLLEKLISYTYFDVFTKHKKDFPQTVGCWGNDIYSYKILKLVKFIISYDENQQEYYTTRVLNFKKIGNMEA